MNNYVYFVQSSSGGNIKIGYSANPIMRLINLRCAHKDKSLKIIGLIEGGIVTENDLHIHFAHLRVDGTREWFTPSSELGEYIKEHAFSVDRIIKPKPAWFEYRWPKSDKSPMGGFIR